MPTKYAPNRIRTRQTTCYHIGDDGDQQKFIDASYEASKYTVLTTGAFAGTANIDMPAYAGNMISFDSATKKILDSANNLAMFKTGDTLVLKGATANLGPFTVATGNVAGEIVTTGALTTEAAGAYLTICKRVAHSNNCVLLPDSPSGKMYSRYTTSGEKVGVASDGKIIWYDTTRCYTLHPAAADLQMVAGGILRIKNGAADPAYFPGAILVCSGFADSVNNLPGYRITSVTVNGADLDLVLWTGNQTVIAEAAGGSRAIKVVCGSVFSFCAAANQVALGGYADWRVPNDLELKALCDMEAPTAVPDATAFPGWPTSDYIWSATTRSSSTSDAMLVLFVYGVVTVNTKASTYFCTLVRG
jgi:hypothetical protein